MAIVNPDRVLDLRKLHRRREPTEPEGPRKHRYRREGALPLTANLHESLRLQWDRLWRQAGATPPAALLDRLLAAWSEPQRHYHTLQHLSECLAHLEPLAALAEHPAEVGLALWFHDAVYALGRQDNEARSAEWAQAEMRAAGWPAASAERVAGLIMATCHDAVPAGRDAEIVVDIDLGILGAPPARFDEYELQVRREYEHLPDAVFRTGRAAVLRQFLAREWIYSTAVFREAFEARARENLERSLRGLGAGVTA